METDKKGKNEEKLNNFDNFDFIKMKEKNCVCYLSLKAESHATFSK